MRKQHKEDILTTQSFWFTEHCSIMIHEKLFKDRLTILIGERGNQTFVRRTGISETTIQQYLSGECLPTLNILEKIAHTNGVTVGWLIGEDPHPKTSENNIQYTPNKSMQEIAQWVNNQHDGINYWEILKAKLAKEYPDFKTWLKQNTN